MPDKQFNFGENWEDYSENYATEEQLHEATEALMGLLAPESVEGKAMLDIGCGSGLHALAALRAGAT